MRRHLRSKPAANASGAAPHQRFGEIGPGNQIREFLPVAIAPPA